LGDPFGLQENAVAGIVSATGRSGSLVPFIQTDIALHFGNSGGPLLDSEGRVVGINAQIYTSPEGYEGVSYAIPINVALSVESELAQVDRRVPLGIAVDSVPVPAIIAFDRLMTKQHNDLRASDIAQAK
jgi:serine protease Do